MICFDDDNTFPQDIKELIYANVIDIKLEKNNETKELLTGKNWNKPIETPLFNITKKSLEDILPKYSARAFHCTRLKNENKLYIEGLKNLEYNTFQQTVIDELQLLVDKDDIVEIRDLFKKYKEQNNLGNREKMLWFVLSKELTYDLGCMDLFKYYGGEITRRALWQKKEKYYSILAEIGNPKVIECAIDLKDARGYQISNLAEQLINYGIHKWVLQNKYKINVEIMILKSIEPKNILRIHDFEHNYS